MQRQDVGLFAPTRSSGRYGLDNAIFRVRSGLLAHPGQIRIEDAGFVGPDTDLVDVDDAGLFTEAVPSSAHDCQAQVITLVGLALALMLGCAPLLSKVMQHKFWQAMPSIFEEFFWRWHLSLALALSKDIGSTTRQLLTISSAVQGLAGAGARTLRPGGDARGARS